MGSPAAVTLKHFPNSHQCGSILRSSSVERIMPNTPITRPHISDLFICYTPSCMLGRSVGKEVLVFQPLEVLISHPERVPPLSTPKRRIPISKIAVLRRHRHDPTATNPRLTDLRIDLQLSASPKRKLRTRNCKRISGRCV